MVILIDHMRDVPRGKGWPFRRAAHMVSTKSFAELHEFAAELGLKREWFQGDHYDISTQYHRYARDKGAEEVSSRELVKRMKKSTARLSKKLAQEQES